MTREYNYFVYITTNNARRPFYTGVTSDLLERTWQHKSEVNEGFSSKYNCKKLVYFEHTDDIYEAMEREKQIKRWRREKKIKLIEELNPKWEDLYGEIVKGEYRI